jgi:hypothetical protein
MEAVRTFRTDLRIERGEEARTIAVTEEAWELMQRLFEARGQPGGWLRIVPPADEREGGVTAVKLQVTDQPEAPDTLLEVDGRRLCIAPQAAGVVGGGRLVVEEGQLVLILGEPATATSAPARPEGRILPANTAQWSARTENRAATGYYQRPLWLVGALTFLTLGFGYPLVWLGITWSEMKRELDDDSMHPWWHALTLLVPIYGLFRVHNHYRTINELLWRVRADATVHPGRAVWGVGIAEGWDRLAGRENVPAVLGLIGPAVMALVIMHGQAGLNNYWNAAAGKVVPSRVHWAEWLGLVLGLIIFGLILLGMVA